MEGRKSLLASLGVALVVAGIALAGTAAAAIVDAPPKRNLAVEWVILGLSVVILGGGAYVFAAALGERLPLPGMKAVRQAAREHALAQLMLTQIVNQGNIYVGKDEITDEKEIAELNAWVGAAVDFVEVVWGKREAALIRGSVRGMTRTALDDGQEWHRVALLPFMERLDGFLVRCHEVPLQTHGQRIQTEKWEALFRDFTPRSPAGTSTDDPPPAP